MMIPKQFLNVSTMMKLKRFNSDGTEEVLSDGIKKVIH